MRIGDGTYFVPSDLAPGLYIAATPSGFCYWARLSGFSGSLDEIIANAATDARQIVEIGTSDSGFETRGCGLWEPVTNQRAASPTITDGLWVVGVEVNPGTYSASGGFGCYWARLSGFSGEFDHLTTNGLPEGRAIVTIEPSDVGFESRGCGEWNLVQ